MVPPDRYIIATSIKSSRVPLILKTNRLKKLEKLKPAFIRIKDYISTKLQAIFQKQ